MLEDCIGERVKQVQHLLEKQSYIVTLVSGQKFNYTAEAMFRILGR